MEDTTRQLSDTEKQACMLLGELTGISTEKLTAATMIYGYETMIKNPTLLDIADSEKRKLVMVSKLTNKGGVVK